MKTTLKLMSFLFGCFLIAIMAIASNPAWLNACTGFIPNPYRHGDLYMLSNMPGFRINTLSKLKSPVATRNKNTTLTIIGDSYTENFDSSLFNAGSYRFIHWGQLPDTIPELDRNKKNIVIVESAERSARWSLIMNNLLVVGKKTSKNSNQYSVELAAENNLQYMLTHFDWVFPFKELKTYIYLNYFNRFSGMVAKPDTSGRLYLDVTTDPANSGSSFNPAGDAEIKTIVENLNAVSSQFTSIGFDEVYISIVPNSASIYKKNRTSLQPLDRENPGTS